METLLADALPVQDADSALLRGMAAGDEEALRALYGRYAQRLFAYAYRLTGDRALAEEVLQDSLLAAWRGARHFRGEAAVATWLLGIVHHKALNAVRRKSLPKAGLTEADELAATDGRPEEHAAAVDRRQAVRAILSGLPSEQRAALQLVFYQGLSMEEVAKVCRCPVGTVKSRLSAAKARLRAALAKADLREEDLL